MIAAVFGDSGPSPLVPPLDDVVQNLFASSGVALSSQVADPLPSVETRVDNTQGGIVSPLEEGKVAKTASQEGDKSTSLEQGWRRQCYL
jgi:hypothetical protein